MKCLDSKSPHPLGAEGVGEGSDRQRSRKRGIPWVFQGERAVVSPQLRFCNFNPHTSRSRLPRAHQASTHICDTSEADGAPPEQGMSQALRLSQGSSNAASHLLLRRRQESNRLALHAHRLGSLTHTIWATDNSPTLPYPPPKPLHTHEVQGKKPENC